MLDHKVRQGSAACMTVGPAALRHQRKPSSMTGGIGLERTRPIFFHTFLVGFYAIELDLCHGSQ
jgi:hypothetical protein